MRQTRSAAKNRAAFEWGRWVAHDSTAVHSALATAGKSTHSVSANPFEPSPRAIHLATLLFGERSLPRELSDLLTRRTAQVIDYQNATLARRYLNLVERVAAKDSVEKDWALTRAITEGWFKLLTYKDEYEVARLHAATDYEAMARDLGIEGEYTLRYHLQPRFLSRMGMTHKLAMGKPFAVLFRVLRHMKQLRGTPFDFLGWDSDRRLERAVAQDYERMVNATLGALPYEAMVELATSAEQVKGYGSVKERNVAAWRERVSELHSAS